ncbi:RNA-directed DNA polymerase, eukaryota [Tanacetum coccineum]
MKLMQFLMGLDDCYQSVRSSILIKDPLPEVKDAYVIVSREESQRGIPESSSVIEGTLFDPLRINSEDFSLGVLYRASLGPLRRSHCLHQSNVRTGSYANIVNGAPIAKNKNSSFPVFDLPALILDETCANDGDLSRHVKCGVGTKYDLLHPHWSEVVFHELQDGTLTLSSIEQCIIEGELMDIEESAGSSFARKRICIKTNVAASILETFKVIFKGKTFMVRAKELFTWTPCFLEYKESEYASDDELPRGMNNKSAQSAQEDDILIQPDMSLSEEPESILDRQERVMRNKVIPFVKILWKNHPEREATWETEESMRASYPHFFV